MPVGAVVMMRGVGSASPTPTRSWIIANILIQCLILAQIEKIFRFIGSLLSVMNCSRSDKKAKSRPAMRNAFISQTYGDAFALPRRQ
jgi:hypothetical protein